MKYDISEEESKKSKIPHEIFLSNLIGNHILWFIASLGLAGSYWQPLAMVPVISLILLAYTLWRARRSLTIDSWYVKCHWQIAAKRSRLFILMLSIAVTVSILGWVGYTYFGMMKVAVMAMVGGIAILPIMVTVLVLILMESDILHQAALYKLPKGIVEQFPNPGVPELEE
ncbi:MAG: hypothetical protein GY934_08500 [Gammaproteobacteria bacterium]|nr:hypothetical protein [Gammaproteobacteria bacterium]